MDKEIGKIPKNEQTDIVLKTDAFGGRPGLTIREFSNSERYTGFTKSGTKIPAEKFEEFKALINGIKPEDFPAAEEGASPAGDAGAGQAALPTEGTDGEAKSEEAEKANDY